MKERWRKKKRLFGEGDRVMELKGEVWRDGGSEEERNEGLGMFSAGVRE